jgi:hypothetical protein
MSGMSVMGSTDAPKSLYIVPWKTSQTEMQTKMNSSLLNEGSGAVDKEVFMRQMDFYELSNTN